jgi:hypothetical protein
MINENKFKELSEFGGENLVSIFIPTHRANQRQKDQINLKNGIKSAKDKLASSGWNEKEAEKYLRPAIELLENDRFWNHLSDGLALFIGPDFFHQEIVPVSFDAYEFVGDRFYLRPLLPLMNNKDRFFLLALSQGEVRFFEGHQYSITPVKIDDLVPVGGMKSIFDYADLPETLQNHSGNSDGQQIYHGQGKGEDDRKEDIKEYFRMINKGLMEMLHDEQPPMVIAAVDYLVPIYKEVNDYKYLMDEFVNGNPEKDHPSLLHEKAWPLVENKLGTDYNDEKENFKEQLGKNTASSLLNDIVPAAVYGKVDTLFVNKDYRLYGYFDKDKNELEILDEYKPGSRDLIELAATQTYLNGGSVHSVEREELPIPTANVNAVFRY